MPAKIGCDAHKQFSVFVTVDGKGKTSPVVRAEHHRQTYTDFLRALPSSSEIALEATGHWYWMVDEMEKAGNRPHLANPTEAKKRMGKTNKTDTLDVKGLAILQPPGLVDLQPAVLLALPVVRLVRDQRFLTSHCRRLFIRNRHFDLPQQVHHLLRTMLFPACHKTPSRRSYNLNTSSRFNKNRARVWYGNQQVAPRSSAIGIILPLVKAMSGLPL